MTSGHISDDDLEQYCLGHSPSWRLPRLEEHILLCPHCQERCEDMQTYVDTIRHALREDHPTLQ